MALIFHLKEEGTDFDFTKRTMAGGAADCFYWEKKMGLYAKKFELENGKRYGLSMGTMICGYNADGPKIYMEVVLPLHMVFFQPDIILIWLKRRLFSWAKMQFIVLVIEMPFLVELSIIMLFLFH
ncbi:unnamed protein product [Medioppia subpectinata]|uniref:Uncharacterized protein n=1 Tax=Medioppia subpectinata TaxID=1979941 RepID=A0A7R9PU14_9ACAR|nr:unnamed protein product [Medioppia subpectinata]CAG2100735.1 unnamed protein product [Medioppia subpectinata]